MNEQVLATHIRVRADIDSDRDRTANGDRSAAREGHNIHHTPPLFLPDSFTS